MEESYIGAEEFSRMAKQDDAVLLRGEIILLEALKFDLVSYSPYRPLQGFLMVLLFLCLFFQVVEMMVGKVQMLLESLVSAVEAVSKH